MAGISAISTAGEVATGLNLIAEFSNSMRRAHLAAGR
jgi:hypothetical protein